MNKNVMKLVVTALACVTLCGTTLAGPAHGGGRKPAPAPVHQKAPAQHHNQRQQNHGRNAAHHAPAPHRAPAPRPHTPPPPPPPPHPHGGHHEANGWAVLGAAVIGGIVGALAH